MFDILFGRIRETRSGVTVPVYIFQKGANTFVVTSFAPQGSSDQTDIIITGSESRYL